MSAVLALGSTPVLAQEAAPTIQVPPAAVAAPETTAVPATAAVVPPAAAPAPTIVLPDVSAATPTAQPVAAAQTEAAAPTASETRTETARPAPRASRSTPQRAAAAPAARATVAEASARPQASARAEAPRASSANILNDAPTRPVAAQATPAAPSPANRTDDGIPGEALAGLLALLGIGAVGYGAMRSRRRRVDTDEAYTAEEMVAAEPVYEEEAAPRTAPVFGTPQHVSPAAGLHYGFAPARGHASDTQVIEREPMTMAPPLAPSTKRTRPAAAMPASMPETADERTTMLDRMVDAEPDEANPFTSRKSRRKRARLLLQQREAEAQSTAAFDWRSYKSSTKPSAPASPPLVTA
ncbi:hypothetical protein [Novosphingobium sp. 9U]|uniref:hypothetical protein n=1 Tax=Novosphingobium sp. 9U TaxID=2653158 RepID=UPI0012F37726|nr:hypothetical protein [Novosphingobium sp. 9U]VWX53402.1 conserved hypothetical protein [Novosphingobium sp. 9U]